MKTLQDDKYSNKNNKTGEVRMGREVTSKKATSCDSGKDGKCSDEKEKARENASSSLV